MAESSAQGLTPESLENKKLYLRPLTPEDMAISYHWYLLTDPQSLSCYPAPFHTAEQAKEEYKAREKSATSQTFMIVRKKDEAAVGHAEFFHLNDFNRSAEVRMMIDPDERKHGIGQEALALLCNFLFRHRGLNKVYTHVGSFNTAGIKLFESVGFKRDGVLRHHHFFNGEFHDEHIYSLLLFEFER